MARTREKEKATDHFQELFVEPPLLYRLFPSILRSRRMSARAAEKAAAKARHRAEIKPRLPIADLLPPWLVEEVRRRVTARRFTASYIAVIVLFCGFLAYNWQWGGVRDGQLAAAQARVEYAQGRFAKFAPVLGFTVGVRNAGALTNTQALDQVDNAAVLEALMNAMPPGGMLDTMSIAFSTDSTGSCSTDDGQDPFGNNTNTPSGIGCVSFAGSVATPSALDAVKTGIENIQGFDNVSVLPGRVDENNRSLFTGSATLGEGFRIKADPAITVDVEGLPETNPFDTGTNGGSGP